MWHWQTRNTCSPNPVSDSYMNRDSWRSLYLDSLQVWSVHNGSLVKFHSCKVALEEPLKLEVRRFSVNNVDRKERREGGKKKSCFETLLNICISCDVNLGFPMVCSIRSDFDYFHSSIRGFDIEQPLFLIRINIRCDNVLQPEISHLSSSPSWKDRHNN